MRATSRDFLSASRARRAARSRAGAVALALALATSRTVAGQTPSTDATGTVVVTAGQRYRASGIHEMFFGADYRKLWTTPIRVEVLDLGTYAGGLRPVRRVGGQETKGLAMKGNDGRDYTFRGVDKDPSSVLPPDLQGTVADRIVQDQIAAAHPAGPVAVAPLSEAAGVLHTDPRLVVMPDDPRLGEFRSVFAGLLGTIEEYPQPVSEKNPGFQGASEIINGEEMWKRLRASANDRVDARAFLNARLFDVMIGDWDRHLKQWRFLKRPDNPLWQPLPEDRDQAFSRFEGLILDLARAAQPRFVKFGRDYPAIVGATFNGWDVDRRLLVGLDKSVWDEVAAGLKERITDGVIAAAVARLPPEFQQVDGARLAAGLKQRRDHLPELANRYYRLLADRVTIQATDEPERVDIERLEGGDVEVRITRADEDGTPRGEPFLTRRFHRSETSEVRLYLYGGPDRVITHGPRDGIKVRVVGGDGFDTLDDSASGGTQFSDSSGNNKVVRGPGTKVDSRPYVPPPPIENAPWIPPRDWGRKTLSFLWVGGNPDVGAFLGGGIVTDGYGFRKDPYADHQVIRAGYATTARSFKAEYEGEYRHSNSGAFTSLSARASGIEILRFYGFGNDTSSAGSDNFFKVHQKQFSLEPSLTFPLARHLSFSFGPRFAFNSTERGNRFIDKADPYGVGDFGEVGGWATLQLDSRDVKAQPLKGAWVWVTGRYFPEVWDVKQAFGSVSGEASTYLTIPGPVGPTLALRAGGKRVFGTYPFHEAAFIGGSSTVRGFRAQRFAGDGSLFGNAELRLRLGRFFLVLPGDFGVFGLADAGRVYFEGESSNRWHTAVGGGLWFAYLDHSRTVTIAVARSDERTGLYLRAGFGF